LEKEKMNPEEQKAPGEKTGKKGGQKPSKA
jgi:hypothetical protein